MQKSSLSEIQDSGNFINHSLTHHLCLDLPMDDLMNFIIKLFSHPLSQTVSQRDHVTLFDGHVGVHQLFRTDDDDLSRRVIILKLISSADSFLIKSIRNSQPPSHCD